MSTYEIDEKVWAVERLGGRPFIATVKEMADDLVQVKWDWKGYANTWLPREYISKLVREGGRTCVPCSQDHYWCAVVPKEGMVGPP